VRAVDVDAAAVADEQIQDFVRFLAISATPITDEHVTFLRSCLICAYLKGVIAATQACAVRVEGGV
jgi:hypothetical protein